MTLVPIICVGGKQGDRHVLLRRLCKIDQSPTALRRAGTLVELLVVMAIISTMAGMVLPAIQGARESARANGCRNHLKQIGLALLHYESTHNHFPKGAEGRFDRKLSPAPMFGLSWWTDTLSHLEGGNVADKLDRTGAWTGWVELNSHNAEVVNRFAPAFFFCPSSPFPPFIEDDAIQVAAPSYVGISGATSHDGFPENRVSPACCFEAEISAGGVLVPNALIRSRQITDGLSRTLLIGEQSDFAYWNNGVPVRIDGGINRGWISGTNALGTPPAYGSPDSRTYNLAIVRYALGEHRYELPGIYYNHGANNPLLSSHPGIVHLLYCDGSVHATLDSMDVVVLKSLATRDDGMTLSE